SLLFASVDRSWNAKIITQTIPGTASLDRYINPPTISPLLRHKCLQFVCHSRYTLNTISWETSDIYKPSGKLIFVAPSRRNDSQSIRIFGRQIPTFEIPSSAPRLRGSEAPRPRARGTALRALRAVPLLILSKSTGTTPRPPRAVYFLALSTPRRHRPSVPAG